MTNRRCLVEGIMFAFSFEAALVLLMVFLLSGCCGPAYNVACSPSSERPRIHSYHDVGGGARVYEEHQGRIYVEREAGGAPFTR